MFEIKEERHDCTMVSIGMNENFENCQSWIVSSVLLADYMGWKRPSYYIYKDNKPYYSYLGNCRWYAYPIYE